MYYVMWIIPYLIPWLDIKYCSFIILHKLIVELTVELTEERPVVLPVVFPVELQVEFPVENLHVWDKQ